LFYALICLFLWFSGVITARLYAVLWQENKSITNVNLGNNSIGPKGAAAIAAMLKVGLICYMF